MRKTVLFAVAVVVGAVAACGDNPRPPPPGNPAIQGFTAAPEQPIAVGALASLIASFTGGTGVVNPGALAIISGAPLPVSPSSTTTYTLVVTAPGGASVSDTATITVNSAAAVLGTDGGTFQTPDGTVLAVPFGALDGDTELSVHSSTDAAPAGIGASSPVYVFEPDGMLFARPVQVTLPLPDGVSDATVYWSQLGGTDFEPVGGTIDAAARTITVTTAHFSRAVIAAPAPTRTILGVGQNTYVSATSRQSVPIDFAAQGVEALLRDASGTWSSKPGVAGTGAAAGTFAISGMPPGEYVLHSGTSYLVTDSSSPDLGALRGGKPGRAPFTADAVAHIQVDGLEPWMDGYSMLEFYASEANSWDFATDRYGSVQEGDTSVSLDFNVRTCNGTGFGCKEIVPSDHAVLGQLSYRVSSNDIEYYPLTRVVEFSPFSLASGGSVNLSGTMRDVSQDRSIALDVRGSQWFEVMRGGHPDARSLCLSLRCFVGILGQPGRAEDGFYSSNADPLVVWVYDESDFETGTMSYGTPEGVASGSWGLLFDVRYTSGFFPAPLPGSTALGGSLRAFGFFNGIEWTTSPEKGAAGPVVPPVSMVRDPKINGENLFADRTGVGLTPTLEWSAPAIGQVSFYRVDLAALEVVSNRTVARTLGSIMTRNTSIALPPGILEEGVPFVVTVAAVVSTSERSQALLADAPFKNGIDRANATLSSGVLTP